MSAVEKRYLGHIAEEKSKESLLFKDTMQAIANIR